MLQLSRRIVLVLTASSAAILAANVGPSRAWAGRSFNNLQYYSNHYWKFCNYDFDADPLGSGGSAMNGHIDHPVTIVFGDGADALTLNSVLSGAGLSNHGASNYFNTYTPLPGNLDTAPNVTYTENNEGNKGYNTCSNTIYHVRYYGMHVDQVTGTQLYNMHDPYWGFYLIATTHEDIHEGTGCSGQKTGYEEDAAQWVESAILGNSHVYSETYNWTWFNNQTDNAHTAGATNYGSCGGTWDTGFYYDPSYVTNRECAQNDGTADFVDMHP